MISGIDRASFLALTFGMAACNTGPSPAVAAIDIPVQPPQPDGGRAEPAVKPEPPPKPVAVAEPEPPQQEDDDDDVGMPTAEGGGAAVATNLAGCGYVDPKTVTRPAAGSCSDDKGTVPGCTMTCSGFAFPKQKCSAYRTAFKPKVAQAALACIARLSATQQCDACKVYRCGDLAMKGSCPDPSADATCAQIRAKCPSVPMADCQRYLSGLTATGRQSMVKCLTSKSGCGFGIFSCAEGLF